MKIYGIGRAMVDYYMDSEPLGFNPGGSIHIDGITFDKLISTSNKENLIRQSGGSCCNTLKVLSHMGHSVVFSGTTGDSDIFGEADFFSENLAESGITFLEGKLRLTESQVNAYIRRAIIEELYGPQNNTGAYPSNLVYGKPAPFSGDKMRVGKFQTWFNANFGGKLVIDGIWGPKTQGAWNMWLQKQYPGIENKAQ